MTLFVWCAGRYFLYTSYFSIFGALFGYKNFGKMVAVDNAVNGLVGLIQLPLTNWALHGLKGNFTAINIIQVSGQAACKISSADLPEPICVKCCAVSPLFTFSKIEDSAVESTQSWQGAKQL